MKILNLLAKADYVFQVSLKMSTSLLDSIVVNDNETIGKSVCIKSQAASRFGQQAWENDIFEKRRAA